MLVESHRNYDFAAKVRNADMVTPDGVPIVWALRWLYGIKQERVAGMDLLPDILAKAELASLPVYFYGSTQTMLDRTRTYTTARYPSLQIAGMYSPPFRSLTKEEENDVVRRINSSGARIVFVVLGCPKQEIWMASMKGRINCTMIGIGGALPVMIGIQKRAPLWMQNAGLEWLFRLIQDPKRLWKRYVVTNSLFLYLLFTVKLKVFLSNKNIISRKVG